MRNLLVGAWRASSTPRAFFRGFVDREPRPGRAFALAAASATVGLAIAGWGLSLATGSSPLVLVLATIALGLPYLFLVWVLGGLAIVRTAQLDVRAWEIAGWSWVPAGVLAVALLPVMPFAPAPALAVGFVLLPLWNVWLVWAGLMELGEARVRLAALIYLAVVFVAPALFTVGTLVLVEMGLGVGS